MRQELAKGTFPERLLTCLIALDNGLSRCQGRILKPPRTTEGVWRSVTYKLCISCYPFTKQPNAGHPTNLSCGTKSDHLTTTLNVLASRKPEDKALKTSQANPRLILTEHSEQRRAVLILSAPYEKSKSLRSGGVWSQGWNLKKGTTRSGACGLMESIFLCAYCEKN